MPTIHLDSVKPTSYNARLAAVFKTHGFDIAYFILSTSHGPDRVYWTAVTKTGELFHGGDRMEKCIRYGITINKHFEVFAKERG